jgi:dinuclear metal center YbgI/SA1388 family protein
MPSMTVEELLGAIDGVVPLGAAGAWDPVGLQVGDPAAPADRVGVCHEVSADVLASGIRANLDVLVSYHPLLFRATTRLVAGPDAPGRALGLAFAGISLIVVHTAFDVARPGTADALLAELGASVGARTFGPVDDVGGADIGRIGTLPEPEPIDALAGRVAAVSGSNPRIGGGRDVAVSSIGSIPGSGDSFIESLDDDIDCYISGDISHHGARSAMERGIAVIDAGHIASERPGVRALYSLIKPLAPYCIEVADDPDPWRT